MAGCNRAGVTLGEPPVVDGGVTITVDAAAPDLAQRLPSKEKCNGVDDDFDGRTDEGCPIRLTFAGDDTMPSLDGKRVAWTRRGADQDSSGIFVRDLPDGTERRVAPDVATVWLNQNRVAFFRTPNYVVLDVDTMKETIIAPITPGYSHGVPILDGNNMIWGQYDPVNEDPWQENYEIYMATLASGGVLRISPYYAGQRYPFIKGERIVWNDDRNGHHALGFAHLFEVWTADLSEGAQPRMLFGRHPDGTDGYIQAFDGERIIFYDINGYVTPSWPSSGTVDGTCTLRMIDFKSGATLYGEETQPYATSDCWYHAFAWAGIALSGKQMVIERDPGGASDLELVNFESGGKRRLTDYPRRSTHPRLDGALLVWQDDRNGDWDLYMMDLSDVDKGDLSVEGLTP